MRDIRLRILYINLPFRSISDYFYRNKAPLTKQFFDNSLNHSKYRNLTALRLYRSKQIKSKAFSNSKLKMPFLFNFVSLLLTLKNSPVVHESRLQDLSTKTVFWFKLLLGDIPQGNSTPSLFQLHQVMKCKF